MEKVKQFLEVTRSDNESVAKYYLELSAGDTNKAVQMLFEDIRDGGPQSSAVEEGSMNQITVLEWNIQGLLEICLGPRMEAVVDIIKLEKPTVIMFQEVTEKTHTYLSVNLAPEYKSFTSVNVPCSGHYFTAIFINTAVLSSFKSSVMSFHSSMQGRDILIVEAKCGERNLVLMTSHLESTKQATDERKRQLVKLYDTMKGVCPYSTVIFGGDTNLRDHEYYSVVSLSKFDVNVVDDVWTMLGSPQNCRFSWDLTKNDNQIQGGSVRLRFERLYTRVEQLSNKDIYRPKSMKFVGTARLPCGMFPSDHWGILAGFSV